MWNFSVSSYERYLIGCKYFYTEYLFQNIKFDIKITFLFGLKYIKQN